MMQEKYIEELEKMFPNGCIVIAQHQDNNNHLQITPIKCDNNIILALLCYFLKDTVKGFVSVYNIMKGNTEGL